MPFKPGDKKPEGSGLKKGDHIKRSLAALEIADEHKVCPITFWCNVINDKFPEATFDHKMAAVKEMAPYLFPKLKQIEHTSEGGVDIFAKLLNKLNGSNP